MMQLSLLILLLFINMPLSYGQNVVNKIIAKVDSEVITQTDLIKSQNDFNAKLATITDPQEREKLKRDNAGKALQNLINQKLLDSELKKSNVDISADEVQETVQGIAYSQKKTMNEFQASLTTDGLTSQQVEENVREDLRKNKFLQQVIFPRIRISDSDLQDYFNNNKSKFSTFGQIRFFQILLTNESLEPGQNLSQIAGSMVDQLKKGSDFKLMAQRYSKGPFASNGGDSGLIATSDMRADLAGFLLKLPLNTISNPIPVPNGFFIFKVIQKASPKPMEFSEAKKDVRQMIFESRVKDEIEKYIAEIRSKHYVEIL